MDINAYLERIGYRGDRAPTLDTLNAVHRAHLTAIPYENLDIHLGRELGLRIAAIYEKIVTRRRGGWCFEMNGLLAWALRELGFDVTMMSSAVGKPDYNHDAAGDHLILRVQLDRPYMADVGFGNGIGQPIPLEVGTYRQGIFEYALATDGTLWTFTNQQYAGDAFYFTLIPRQLADFSERCTYLQTSPESGFVRVTVCYRFTPDGYIGLRGAVLHEVTAAGKREQTIEEEATYRRVLSEKFDLNLSDDEISTLWQTVWRKHQDYLIERAALSKNSSTT